MSEELLILHLEDDDLDAELTQRRLKQTGLNCQFCRARGQTEYEKALLTQRFDLILSDYRLPGYDGRSALELARAQQPATPFIMLSGALGEEEAVECVLLGATDYVLKERLQRLVPAVTRALSEARERKRRKDVEARLATEQAFGEALLSNLPGVCLLCDEAGRLLRWNRQLETVTGYSGTELALMQASDLFADEPEGFLARHAHAAFTTGRDSLEAEVLTRHGERRPFYLSAVSVVVGDKPCLIEEGVDISLRKQAEAALRQAHARLEARVAERTSELSREVAERRQAEHALRKLGSAVEQSPASVVITDRNGVIEYVNPRFETQTGYRKLEVLGQNPRILKSGTHPPEFYARMWETLLAGHPWRGELHNRRKDGTLFWESTAIAPVRDGQDQLTHFVAIKEDITDQRRVAEALRQAKEAADAANAAKSRFLANMSHEIRTPMGAILGFSQLMLRDPALSSQQRQWLRTLSNSGEHLLHLLNDVLDMSKIEAGRLQVALAPCHLPTLLANVIAMFRLRTEEKGLRFECQTAPDLPEHLLTDPGKVQQVLVNILSNAVKFTPQGSIRISAGRTPLPAGREGDAQAEVWFEVADTGVGIVPEEMGQLFKPFEQTESGRNQQGGTGLGLAISRQLARLLGGNLTATSQLGVGSCFRFTFAAKVLSAGPPALPPPASPRRVVGLKAGTPPPLVLVADDSADNRALLRELLAGVGFDVREAANGAEAVSRCDAEHPALVLMDRRMPGLDGLAATEAIRQSAGGRSVHILMVTADVCECPREDVERAGADGLVCKPFDCEDLLARIGTLLNLEFLYQDKLPPDHGEPAKGNEGFVPLPVDLRKALLKALEEGDLDGLCGLIERDVAAIDPARGQSLREMAVNYDYVNLRRALKAGLNS